jgi:hypothetical protein
MFLFKKRENNKKVKKSLLKYNIIYGEDIELGKLLSSSKLNKNEIILELTECLSRFKNDLKSNDEHDKFQREHIEFQSKYIKELQEKLKTLDEKNNKLIQNIYDMKLLIPDEFPYRSIMSECANAAWYGTDVADRKFKSEDGNIELLFYGTVYEPSYESFTAGCCVYGVDNGIKEILYSVDSRNVSAYRNEKVESGDIDDIKKWIIEKNCKFYEVK